MCLITREYLFLAGQTETRKEENMIRLDSDRKKLIDLYYLKKFGFSLRGWYPTMVLPFSIIIALIFGAT